MKIFVLGATGYIGGDALYAIANAHPEYEITCLVRNSEKGGQVASQYSKARLVYGDLDSADLIKEESSKANVVCNFANADHPGAATSIIAGLSSTATVRSPGYYIHTSGTGVLLFADMDAGTYGEARDHIYNDWDDISTVTSLPSHALHRNVDEIVLAASSSSHTLRTAIVCPPTIYGAGRGPGNKTSHQLPGLAKCTLQAGHGIQVGAGKTFWTSIHVSDLSQLFLLLVEAAEPEKAGAPASWNEEGYYFCEDGDFVWGEMSKLVAESAAENGWISDKGVQSYSAEEANKVMKGGAVIWGANSRARAIRARKLFGWTPKGHGIREEVPLTVAEEARKLGMVKGHREVAAGDA